MNRHQAQTELRQRYVTCMNAFAAGDISADDWQTELERIADSAWDQANRLRLHGLDRSEFIRAVCEPVEANA